MSQIDINTQSYLDIKNSVRQYLLSEADDKGNIDVNEFNNWLTTTHDITSGDLKDAAKEDKKQIEKGTDEVSEGLKKIDAEKSKLTGLFEKSKNDTVFKRHSERLKSKYIVN